MVSRLDHKCLGWLFYLSSALPNSSNWFSLFKDMKVLVSHKQPVVLKQKVKQREDSLNTKQTMSEDLLNK